jgi:IS30 family transposase
MRAIARRLGRSPSTVSRELRRNADRHGYRATTAHALAHERASRPKPAKRATNLALRQVVQDDLQRRDPHAPWQRGSNENTNGLLRQYFPKGTDFGAISEAELDAVADELSDRPRKRLDFANPTEQLAELLLQ